MAIGKKDFWNFFKYLFMGIVVSSLNVLFSWIFIDIFGIKAIFSSTMIGISIFLIKYYSYTKINLIQKKFKIFMIISISSIILYILLTAFFIDILLFPTLIVIPIVVIFLFLLRFFAFYWTKIIRKDPIPIKINTLKNKKIKKSSRNFWIIVGTILLLLILITLSTKYYGSTDLSSFKSPAKYFAGYHQAKIRSSHSYLWGFVNAPLVFLFKNFIGFKIFNLIILTAIILSIYYMSKKDKRALFLILFSPIIWYMAPWINSIQIASLFFLWNYFFMQKYDKSNKIKYLFYSGIFFGLSVSFWHAILFLGFFYILFFFYNKRVLHLIYYLIFILIGLMPLLILDFFLFGFPFHSLFKNVFGTTSNTFALGVYSMINHAPKTFIRLLSLFLIIPIYFWVLYKKENFKKSPKTILFLTTSLLFFAKNPQIRYLLIVVPIMILNLIKILDKKQIKKLLIFSAIISLIVIIPYEIQIKYSDINGNEFTSFLENLPNLKISSYNEEKVINEDLIKISEEYPDQIFLVGNKPDYYNYLAEIYWGDQIKEFISIQDYNLFLKNSSVLIEREIRFSPSNINGRREFWIKGGIGKPLNDPTDYLSITYAISLEENLEVEGFDLVKKYNFLSLFSKERDL